ncbi:probable indole-3-pyruvate monooxygenase YUCCA10 [Zingiber officinale]|uniref:probable indole-3-pyruvate monooxygenase YUCCA10 n=1 Tax=Zingiber officinale TaxID=94328 RepID=UPI001C4DA761|nr:probable indole-3-pyruvate monooxygenase YUCCA10 [Zingiber officinale]
MGIVRPSKGPFATGKSSVIDVGTVAKIKTREIKARSLYMTYNHNDQVRDEEHIKDNKLKLENGETNYYDHIIFATGFRSTAKNQLKDGEALMDDKGMLKEKAPRLWKGKNGLYCVGFGQAGLAGIALDAQNVANDIKNHYV